MKNNKSFIGKLITMGSFMYIIYIAMRDRGYLEDMKEKLKEGKDKIKDKIDEMKNGEESDWYEVDAEEILRQRFASGEIDEEEFNKRITVLKK